MVSCLSVVLVYGSFAIGFDEYAHDCRYERMELK